jgi:hypothetical protein
MNEHYRSGDIDPATGDAHLDHLMGLDDVPCCEHENVAQISEHDVRCTDCGLVFRMTAPTVTWHCLCGARVALQVDRIVPDHLDNHGRWCAFSRCTIAPRFLAATAGCAR